MRWIFNIDKQGGIKIDKDVIKISPILSKLDEDELRYIILVYDYVYSPYKRKPIEERKVIVSDELGFKRGNHKFSKYFKDAVEAYKGMVFCSKRETIDVYNSKINSMNNLLLKEKNYEAIVKLDKSIGVLQKRIDEYEKMLEAEDSNVKLKGDKELSFIEKLIRNGKLYEISKRDGIYSDNKE